MIEIKVEDRATDFIKRQLKNLEDKRQLHAEMGMSVERKVLQHIRLVKVPQGNALRATSTGFWQKALASVRSTSDNIGATVSIPHKGVRMQYAGGTISTTKRSLTIPINPLAHGKSVAEIGKELYVFLSKKENLILAIKPTSAEQAEYNKKRKKKTKGTGKPNPLPYRGGKPLYVLKDSVTIKPHSDVLPTARELTNVATEAANNYIARRLGT